MKNIAIVLILLCVSSCAGLPENVKPVSNFELDRYLGKWYEIARLDHSFERGLEQVTAEYSLKKNGDVKVLNKGYSPQNNEWKEAEGKAYLVNAANEGYLKVSFFGPFYGSYVVFELEQDNYEYAFVAGPNTNYLWLLSRRPTVPLEILNKFKKISKELGFNTENLILVKQNSE